MQGKLYIKNESEEYEPIGKTQEIEYEIPRMANGGVVKEIGQIERIGEMSFRATLTLVFPKTVTKKRFIKLLMSKGLQKREAIKLHDIYMDLFKSRYKLSVYACVSNINIYKYRCISQRKDLIERYLVNGLNRF